MFLYLTKKYSKTGYRENGGTDPRVLIVGTRWRLMFSITPPSTHGKRPSRGGSKEMEE